MGGGGTLDDCHGLKPEAPKSSPSKGRETRISPADEGQRAGDPAPTGPLPTLLRPLLRRWAFRCLGFQPVASPSVPYQKQHGHPMKPMPLLALCILNYSPSGCWRRSTSSVPTSSFARPLYAHLHLHRQGTAAALLDAPVTLSIASGTGRDLGPHRHGVRGAAPARTSCASADGDAPAQPAGDLWVFDGRGPPAARSGPSAFFLRRRLPSGGRGPVLRGSPVLPVRYFLPPSNAAGGAGFENTDSGAQAPTPVQVEAAGARFCRRFARRSRRPRPQAAILTAAANGRGNDRVLILVH